MGWEFRSRAEEFAEPLGQALADIARLSAEAQARGIALPAPPEAIDPQTCCGRGCFPCMYTYYFEAVEAWRARAGELLGTAGAEAGTGAG
jgi:hypothetical protein